MFCNVENCSIIFLYIKVMKGTDMVNSTKNQLLVGEIEEMIKKYNKKPEKKIKKRDIINFIQKIDVIVAVRMNLDDSQVFGEIIDNISMRPDIVKDGARVRLLPVFTSYDQLPIDYMNTFSLIKMPASAAYAYVNRCEELNGMVVNPFTELNFEVRKKVTSNTRTHIPQMQTTKQQQRPSAQSNQAMIIYNNQKYVIDKSPFTIGRENANLVIPQSYISKIHTVISYKDNRFRVADYDSTNGTRLNGKLLKPKVYYELRDGYVIELSDKEQLVVYIN